MAPWIADAARSQPTTSADDLPPDVDAPPQKTNSR
jgi:hypothetical protein